MYLKKENIISFCDNNYICFKSLYAHDMVICFSAGFLIPFLCDPDLQCVQYVLTRTLVKKAERPAA
jgi:hypothetical protein